MAENDSGTVRLGREREPLAGYEPMGGMHAYARSGFICTICIAPPTDGLQSADACVAQ